MMEKNKQKQNKHLVGRSHGKNNCSKAGTSTFKFMPIEIISMNYPLCTEMDSTHPSFHLLLALKDLQIFSDLKHSLLSETILGGRGHHHLFILVYSTTEYNLNND